MGKNIRKYSIFLATVQICCLLTPSHAMFDFFGGGGGGGGGSDVAEILAAGLITKMLMEDFFHIQGAPLLQSLRHQFIGGYGPRHPPVHHQPVRHYPQMIAPRIPLAMSAQYVYPMVPRHPVHLMTQASYMQQARHPLVSAPWNGQYRGAETFVNAYLPVQQESNTPPFIEALLTNEALSAATLLLNSDILEDDEEEEEEVEMREEVPDVPAEAPAEKQQAENRSETFEASASEHESRYILPRIVRHFVQRIMRRVEQHR